MSRNKISLLFRPTYSEVSRVLLDTHRNLHRRVVSKVLVGFRLWTEDGCLRYSATAGRTDETGPGRSVGPRLSRLRPGREPSERLRLDREGPVLPGSTATRRSRHGCTSHQSLGRSVQGVVGAMSVRAERQVPQDPQVGTDLPGLLFWFPFLQVSTDSSLVETLNYGAPHWQ